jgi:class 3 adenylate cyclase
MIFAIILKKVIKQILLLLIVFLNLLIISCSARYDQKDKFLTSKPKVAIHYYKDKTNSLIFKQISSVWYSKKFIKSEKNVLFFGISDAAYWIKVRINNPSNDSNWCLHLNYIQNSYIDVYDSSLLDYDPIFKTGFLRPVSERPINAMPYAFPLKFNTFRSTVIYLKIVSNGSVIIPVSLIKRNEINNISSKNNLWYGIYFGILIGLFFYNLFLFIGLCDRVYLYYICIIASSLVFFATLSGHMLDLFLIKNVYFNEILIEFSLSCIMIFGGLFAVNLLKIRSFSMFLYKLFVIFITINVLSLPLTFLLDLRLIQEIQYVLLPTQIFITLLSAILSWKNKNIAAAYYILAWIGYMAGGIINILMYRGILPFNEITIHAPEVGSGIEVILLSLVLSKRYQILKNEKEYVIQYALAIQKEANESLEQKVKERTEQLNIEKKKSDVLLLNILPEEIAEELKIKGSVDAKNFEYVTVMFTDFKNFTKISEKLSPTELVAEIHNYFKVFDTIISKYNIEKIKTIGDSYMCAGGLPVANKTNASDVILAAIEIQKFMQNDMRQRINEMKPCKEIFEIRIGINTGAVVAGIVGVKKFAYDIWGDTVNIASRMESSGIEGKINISGSTYKLVKDKFKCTYRGKIEARNKGEIDMYFVELE